MAKKKITTEKVINVILLIPAIINSIKALIEAIKKRKSK